MSHVRINKKICPTCGKEYHCAELHAPSSAITECEKINYISKCHAQCISCYLARSNVVKEHDHEVTYIKHNKKFYRVIITFKYGLVLGCWLLTKKELKEKVLDFL